MNSEDIARYVRDLEAEVERERTRANRNADAVNANADMIVQLRSERDEARADTSRVSFGVRYERTGMVLLQHADMVFKWGKNDAETARWHRERSSDPKVSQRFHAAHAALAGVREALNTAESVGVDVWPDAVICGAAGPLPDAAVTGSPLLRACRLLAREVQALVGQGIRGDDLNARLPYEVRDHRVQEADTSSGDEAEREAAEVESLAAVLCAADDTNPYEFDGAGIHLRCTYRDMARAVLAHRARREGGA